MGQTRSNHKMNANHQPRALEKPASHRKTTRIGQPVPAGQAVCRSKQVKPNSQVHGQTTSVITPSKSTIGLHGSNQVKPQNERQPPASGSREACESPQGDQNRAARPVGHAVCRSKQVKPKSPLRGLTTGALDKDSGLLHILIL